VRHAPAKTAAKPFDLSASTSGVSCAPAICTIMIKRLLVQIVIGVVLFLVIDVLVLVTGLAGARERADAANRTYRVRHDVVHHSLAPSFSGQGRWGGMVYAVHTNDLGFLDAQVRQVPKQAGKPRVVVVGDSFGESIGFGWNESFVGRFAAARGDIDVLNASVSSYSPIVYYRKVKWLLDQGYKVDHVVVSMDISDIQDEAQYVMDGDKVVIRQPRPGEPAAAQPEQGRLAQMLLNLPLTSIAYFTAKSTLQKVRGYDSVFNRCRSAWTYDGNSLATDAHYRDTAEGQLQEFATCERGTGPRIASGEKGNIDRAVARAVHWMSELHELLRAQGIALSVMVYPWPAQLHHDDRDSRQVRIWRDWCAGRCAHFVDTFPDFFAVKAAQPQTWYRDLYIPGDVHFNARGNQMLADKLHAVIAVGR
jgi:hypothetical protein